MSEINGVQLARLWAQAWKDIAFRNLLESNPLTAAQQFKAQCDANPATHAPFPDPSQMSLLDIEEYHQAIVIFKNIPSTRLDNIMRKIEAMPWTKSKFLKPDELKVALLNGEHEVY